jgi:hypothetical protein
MASESEGESGRDDGRKGSRDGAWIREDGGRKGSREDGGRKGSREDGGRKGSREDGGRKGSRESMKEGKEGGGGGSSVGGSVGGSGGKAKPPTKYSMAPTGKFSLSGLYVNTGWAGVQEKLGLGLGKSKAQQPAMPPPTASMPPRAVVSAEGSSSGGEGRAKARGGRVLEPEVERLCNLAAAQFEEGLRLAGQDDPLICSNYGLLLHMQVRHHALNTMHSTPCTMHSTRCTQHDALNTMHHAPCTMHHAPCTMHHAPCTTN